MAKYRMYVYENTMVYPEEYTLIKNANTEEYLNECIYMLDTGNGVHLEFPGRDVIRMNYAELGSLFEVLLWQSRRAQEAGHAGLINRNAYRRYTEIRKRKKACKKKK